MKTLSKMMLWLVVVVGLLSSCTTTRYIKIDDQTGDTTYYQRQYDYWQGGYIYSSWYGGYYNPYYYHYRPYYYKPWYYYKPIYHKQPVIKPTIPYEHRERPSVFTIPRVQPKPAVTPPNRQTTPSRRR